MDAFAFRRKNVIYYLVAAEYEHDVLGRDGLSVVDAERAGALLEQLCRGSQSELSRLHQFLALQDHTQFGFAVPQGDGELDDVLNELDRGPLGVWRLFSFEQRLRGVLTELAELDAAPDKKDEFGWIEFDLLDQNDVPVTGLPYVIKQGSEIIKRGRLNKHGNVYADGIKPGTYTFAIEAEKPEDVEPSSFVTIELYDARGFPVTDEPFSVVDAAGKTFTGMLDQNGQASILDIAPGDCEVCFTRLDEKAWALADEFEPMPAPSELVAPAESEPIDPPPREFDPGPQENRAFPVDAVHFQFDSAFPGATTFSALSAMHDAAEKNPGRLVVFGHADKAGKDDYNKNLSDRRARVVLAILTQNLDTFDAVAKDDSWSLIQYQAMLAGLGITPMDVDGEDGPITQAGVKAFQQRYSDDEFHADSVRERAYDDLDDDGVLGTLTKAAIRDAYLALAKRQLSLSQFVGPKFAGCSEFNELSYDAAENRRVSLAIFPSSEPSDQEFPCKVGNAKACPVDLSQAKAEDPKRVSPPKFRCSFYRKHIVESFVVPVDAIVQLLDDAGNPLVNTNVIIELPDKSRNVFMSDANGQVRLPAQPTDSFTLVGLAQTDDATFDIASTSVSTA